MSLSILEKLPNGNQPENNPYADIPDKLQNLLQSIQNQNRQPPPPPKTPDNNIQQLLNSLGKQNQQQNLLKLNENQILPGVLNSGLMKILQSNSPNDPRFQCPDCGKFFKNNAGFKMHMRSHGHFQKNNFCLL